MKPLKYVFFGAAILIVGCIKTSTPPGTSSLNIINAIPGNTGLVTNLNGSGGGKTTDSFQYYNSALQIGYDSWAELSSYTGAVHVSLPQYSDTLLPLYSGVLNMQIGGIYSFFLTGTDTLHADTLFTKDNIPYYPYTGDSVFGVRFVNLSTGSQPVLVTIQSDPNHVPIASNIAYKTITPFQQLPADASALNNGYTFEIRDAATNTILTTVDFYTYTYPALVPFKSVTVCLIGQPGASAAVPQSGLIYPNY